MSDPLTSLPLGKQPLGAESLTGRVLGSPSGLPSPPANRLIYQLYAASPQEEAVRAPGDIWAWHTPTRRFKRYSDNTKIPIIGGGSTELIQVAGYQVAMLRRAMESGLSVSQGDLLWHQNPSGQANVIQLVSAGPISCPAPWELVHASVPGKDAQDDYGNVWRTGVSYEIDHGAYQEPATVQELTEPVGSGSSGTATVTGRRVTNLVEGADEAWQLDFTGDRIRSWETPGTHNQGVHMAFGLVLQVDGHTTTGDIRLRNGTAANDFVRINVDFRIGKVELHTGEWLQYRWLGNGAVFIAAGNQTQNAPDGPTRLTLHLASGAVYPHCVNIAPARYMFQPIPSQVTRSPDSRAIISSSYPNDWTGNGLDIEGQLLCFSTSYRNDADNVVFFGWFSSGGKGFPKRRAANNQQIIWNWGPNENFSQVIQPSATNFSAMQTAADWSAGVGTDLYGCLPRDAIVTSNGPYHTPTASSTQGIYYGGAGSVHSPTAIRALAYWNRQGSFDPEMLFGPSAHNGLPLLPTS